MVTVPFDTVFANKLIVPRPKPPTPGIKLILPPVAFMGAVPVCNVMSPLSLSLNSLPVRIVISFWLPEPVSVLIRALSLNVILSRITAVLVVVLSMTVKSPVIVKSPAKVPEELASAAFAFAKAELA